MPFISDVCCVTGAGGFQATELVKQLLERGFHVRGTVRDLERMEKYEHLTKIAASLPGRLELFEADLTKPGSFDKCALGAKYFFHTAAAVDFGAKDAKTELVDPAVEGITHILHSCAKGGVQRIVVTGSIGAVYSLTKDDKPLNGELWTEADYNTVSEKLWQINPSGTVDGVPHGYMASKVLSEQAILKLSKELGLDVVVILPSGIFGPLYSKRVESLAAPILKRALEGEKVEINTPWCDSRDVAKAHIEAALRPEASGRYLVSQPGMVPSAYISKTLIGAFPELDLAAPEGSEEVTPWLDNTKAKSLIGELVPLEQSIVDMARTMLSAELVEPKKRIVTGSLKRKGS